MSGCHLEGCYNAARTKGLCNAHYLRLLKYGDPTKGRTNAKPGQPLRFAAEVAALPYRDECVIWPYGKFDNGYGSVFHEGKNRGSHVVVCELAHGSCPADKDEAAHECGNRACVNPHHLRWATKQQNAADRLEHGTGNRGERHNMAKLTERDVLSIRSDSRQQKEIAEDFGVTSAAIWMIKHRRSWAWMEMEASDGF